MGESSLNPEDVCVTVTPDVDVRFEQGSRVGVRITLVASDGVGMPNEIFRFRRYRGGKPGRFVDEFTGVCSAADLDEYPALEPPEDRLPKFYRNNSVDLTFRSTKLAEEALSAINREIGILIATVRKGLDLVDLPPVDVGDPLTE